MNRFHIHLFFVCTFFILSGCSSRFLYESLQEIESQRCNDLESTQERQECLDKVYETSYDQYQKERHEQSQKERYDHYQNDRYEKYIKEQEEAQNNR